MKRMSRIVALLLCFVWSPLWAQGAAWPPAGYITKPMPPSWVPLIAPSSSLTLADVISPARPPLTLPEFVGRFGSPHRYLVPERAQNGYSGMLIYNLPSGHTVVLHVGTPPEQSIGAIVVKDPSGKDVRLIK